MNLLNHPASGQPDWIRRNIVHLEVELHDKRKGSKWRERRREIRDELKQWRTMLAVAALTQ